MIFVLLESLVEIIFSILKYVSFHGTENSFLSLFPLKGPASVLPTHPAPLQSRQPAAPGAAGDVTVASNSLAGILDQKGH